MEKDATASCSAIYNSMETKMSSEEMVSFEALMNEILPFRFTRITESKTKAIKFTKSPVRAFEIRNENETEIAFFLCSSTDRFQSVTVLKSFIVVAMTECRNFNKTNSFFMFSWLVSSSSSHFLSGLYRTSEASRSFSKNESFCLDIMHRALGLGCIIMN